MNGFLHSFIKHKDFVNLQKGMHPEILRPPTARNLGQLREKKQGWKLAWFKKLTRRVVLIMAEVNSKTK